jgi:hypothetical protein
MLTIATFCMHCTFVLHFFTDQLQMNEALFFRLGQHRNVLMSKQNGTKALFLAFLHALQQLKWLAVKKFCKIYNEHRIVVLHLLHDS